MKKILVIGATGMLGKPVTTALDEAGFDLTLLARDKYKMSEIFPGKKVVAGDVFNRESLRAAMKGNEIVYVNLSISQSSKEEDPQTEREGMDNIIAVAKETGLKKIVLLSSLVQFYNNMNGFHWWAFDIKHSAIEKIKESGLDYTIFYPSTFMETFVGQLRIGKRVILMSGSVAPMWFIAADDYAKQVVKSLKQASTERSEFIVQGPEPLTMDEAARLFVQNHRASKLSLSKAPMGLMRFFALFSQKINYGVNICEALNKYPEKFEAEKTWSVLGRPTTTIKEFAGNT